MSKRKAPSTAAKPPCTMSDVSSLTDANERVLWSGSPRPLRYMLKKSFPIFPFGIFFFGFSLFWIKGAAMATQKAGDPFEFPFWWFGIPFVCVGLGMVLSPFWFYLRAKQTIYVLTDRRAITAVGGPFAQRSSVPLEQMPFIDVRTAADGSGHILFQQMVANRYGWNTSTGTRDGFIAVPDVGAVEKILRSAIEKLRS